MIKAICSSKSVHTQLGDPKDEPTNTYQITFNVSSESQDVYTKLSLILCKTEFDRYDVGGTYTLTSTAAHHTDTDKTLVIPFRGSVTDLATDIAFELTIAQGIELVEELQRFLRVEPGKFKS
jgi:hypothetical protein